MSKFRRQLMMSHAVRPEPPTPVLPYDAEVEWLQSDGSAYLDTGIKAAGNLYIKTYLVDFFVNDNGGKWPFGGRTSSSSGMFGMLINNNSKKVFLGYNTSSGTIGFNTCTSYPQSAVVEIGDGNVKIGSTSHTYTKATFTSTQNVTLFGLNNGGSQIVADVKIGPTYLTDGTNTVDLIPVRKDGVGFFYDKVSRRLFSNAGTGSFVIGPDKGMLYNTEVEYLESSGTQWIDTGINLRQILHTTMDVMITKDITTNSCLCGLFVDSSYPRYQLYINGNQQWATLTTTNAQYYNYSGITAGASVAKNVRYTPTLNSLQVQNYDMTIYLFARNHSSNKLAINGLRMYSCNIVDDNNVKLREYIPVRVGQAGYLYDKVSGTLFGNTGSGDFIIGNDVS